MPSERKSKPATGHHSSHMSLLVSLFAGVMLSPSWREYVDATVHTKEQVERQAGLALLVTSASGRATTAPPAPAVTAPGD